MAVAAAPAATSANDGVGWALTATHAQIPAAGAMAIAISKVFNCLRSLLMQALWANGNGSALFVQGQAERNLSFLSQVPRRSCSK